MEKPDIKDTNETKAPVAKTEAKTETKEKSAKKKNIFTMWQFWVGVVGVAVVVAVILILVLWPKTSEQNNNNGGPTTACQAGGKDMLSGGEWIVGSDFMAGDYMLSSEDYFFAYIYENEAASDYIRTIYLGDNTPRTYFHFTDGQKVKVSSGSVNMVCQDLGDINLVSVGEVMKSGNYTVVSTDEYFFAYVYKAQGDEDYESTIWIDDVAGEKSLRFKDGQYMKVSSGNAFLIDMSSSEADTLVTKAKELAKGALSGAVTKPEETPKPEEKPETKPTNTETPTTSSVNWQQFIKEYEAWVDDYVAFMEKYQSADAADMATLMSDYTTLLTQMSEWSEKMDNIEDDLSGSDLTEYLNALSRIAQKLNLAN